MHTQTTHNLRVSADQGAQLRGLVRTGWMRLTTEPVSGLAGGRVYVPGPLPSPGSTGGTTNGCSWVAWCCRPSCTGCRRWSSWRWCRPHRATRGTRTRPCWSRTCWGGWTRRSNATWIRRVIQTTLQGRRALPVVLGASGARWLQSGTRLVELEGLWFVSLTFELPAAPRRAGGVAIGIDVGLSPLVTAAGPGALARLAPPALPDRLRWAAFAAHLDLLPPTAQRELRGRIERLHYAAARQRLDHMTAWLLDQAACVGVERLDWRTFSTDFPERGREMAMVDWLQSWLPQRLYAAGVSAAPGGAVRHQPGVPPVRPPGGTLGPSLHLSVRLRHPGAHRTPRTTCVTAPGAAVRTRAASGTPPVRR